MQKEQMEALKKNPQQQKMLNEILSVTNDSIKKEFPNFAKLVQADVLNVILKNCLNDGKSLEDVSSLSKSINDMMTQVGKDLEAQMMKQFANLKEEATK